MDATLSAFRLGLGHIIIFFIGARGRGSLVVLETNEQPQRLRVLCEKELEKEEEEMTANQYEYEQAYAEMSVYA